MNMVNETGQYFWYYHDDEGRLTRLDLPGTEDMSYTYDDNDRVTSVTYVIPGGTGLESDVTSFAYDELGRITSVDGPDTADTVSYTHNEVGNRATMSVNGITTAYTYDEMNRLLSVTSPYASASYAYANGLLDIITYSNGDTVEYGYDSLDRLSSLVSKNSAESVLASYNYSYGLPTAITDITGGDELVDSYQYDDIYRLTRETRHYQSNVIQNMRRFGYDEVGNRTRYAGDGRVTTATFTQDNQLIEREIGASLDVIGKAKTGDWEVSVNGTPATVEADGTFIAEGLSLPEGPNTLTASGEDPGTMETDTHEITVTKLPQEDVTYTFDNRGNMTGKTDATGTTNYLWFYTNRLKRIEFPDTTRHRYYYDGLGRRVLSKEDGKDDRRFVYDGWNVIGEKTEGSEEFVAYYTRGADMGGGIGGIISVHRNGTPAQYPDGYHTGDYFYHYNHRGDVVSVTNSSGAEVAHYRYDAFGNVVEKTGDFESPYQFSTKEYSSETGLIYYGYRFYMPDEGRWLNKDPLGYIDGWNLYGFVTNHPINFVDPYGLVLDPFTWGVIIGGGVAGWDLFTYWTSEQYWNWWYDVDYTAHSVYAQKATIGIITAGAPVPKSGAVFQWFGRKGGTFLCKAAPYVVINWVTTGYGYTIDKGWNFVVRRWNYVNSFGGGGKKDQGGKEYDEYVEHFLLNQAY